MARLGVFSVGLLCVCLAGHAEDARDSTPLTFWPLPLSAPVLPLGSRAPSVTETVRATSEPSGRRQDVLQAQSREALSKDVAEQLDAIEAERARSGERSPELIALLASLASSYEQLGDYRSADAALEQAIDLARVNFGLHSLEQADVVASLVATRQTSGDFGGAAEKRRYLRELVSRNFYDPRVVGILTEIAEQEMDNARQLVGVPAPFPIGFSAVAADPLGIGPPTPSLVALHAAQSDYVAAIQAAVRTHTGNTADVFALEDALSNTVYFELAHPEILGAAGGHSPGRGMGPASWYPTLGFKGGLILRHKALDSMSFRRSPVDVALDLLALADWYLVFGSYEGVTAGGTKSYGTVTAAGLLSLLFAGADKKDPRVQAAYKWLTTNYTLDSNPGTNTKGGLFYYYQALSKVTSAYGDKEFVDGRGQRHNWRNELADRLILLQNPDGSWINKDSGLWWEDKPELATA